MSPRCRYVIHRNSGFPRVSGDEPATSKADQCITEFSPRERG